MVVVDWHAEVKEVFAGNCPMMMMMLERGENVKMRKKTHTSKCIYRVVRTFYVSPFWPCSTRLDQPWLN